MNFRQCVSFNDKLVRQFSLSVYKHQKTINHYDCLGITPKASQSDVKTAYYKLSKKFHPDLNKGNPSAASKFRDISAAYEVLGNVKARKLYDRSLSVRGINDYSPTIDAEKDDYDHAPFYHGRNKPQEKRPSRKSNQNIKYDVDEWTKAHYSRTFTNAKIKREETIMYDREVKQFKEESALVTQGLGVLGLFLLSFAYFAYATSNDYDVPSHKSEKPD